MRVATELPPTLVQRLEVGATRQGFDAKFAPLQYLMHVEAALTGAVRLQERAAGELLAKPL